MGDTSSGFTIDEIVLILGLSKRTGELVLESGNNIGSMLFHEGLVLHAFSPYSRAIGDLLVEDGVLSELELIEVLKLQKSEEHVPLGSLVMRAGKVSLEIVEMLVHAQIREAVTTFRGWDNINVSFVTKPVTPFDTISLPVHEFVDLAYLQRGLEALEEMVKLKSESATASQ
jgi:glutaredoxin-related protein